MSDLGLHIGSLPIDTFIKINMIPEVTNPIYLQKNTPTPDGVLSYEIFGTSTYDRANRMAYIDLKGHYMRPLAAKKLNAYDRRLNNILYSTQKYALTKDGDLIKDDDNGKTGPEFLYSIWGKVKVKDKETITSKEVEKYFKQTCDELFITKYPVIPAFYRDINDQTGSKMSMSKINSTYSSMIAYAQNLASYSDTFTDMKYITQARLQSLIVQVYDSLIIEKLKGQPSKFGMLRRFLMSKNIDYSARLVISAPVLNVETVSDVQAQFGYAVIPLAYVCSCFFPFIVHHLKKFFDASLLQCGKIQVYNVKTESYEYITVAESFDESQITKMITKYINSPSTRFDKVPIPTDTGRTMYLTLTGRFMKDNTTFTRPATITDILYIVATRAAADKHVYVTRYPLENYNGQFAARVRISSTIITKPVMIGDEIFEHYPYISNKVDPTNAFVETMGMSNCYLDAMGADYDGDQISIKPVFLLESNIECEERIQSNAYIFTISGSMMRGMSKDFILTAYNLTKTDSKFSDINNKKPLYKV